MSAYWNPLLARLAPYVPGEQPKVQNLIKLNTNEHPFGPSPKVIQAIRAAADDALRLYPDPHSDRLRHAISVRYGVDPGTIFVGNGSDEVLAHVFVALLKHDAPLYFPDITYSFYPTYCKLYDIASEAIALTDDFSIDVEDYLPGRRRPAAGGIIFPNPNAPTGRALPLPEIERIVAGNPHAVVVIDEAYVDFGSDSAVGLTTRYPNLLVVQTLSKSRSLAGLRVGFAIGDRTLIEGLERVKNSFNSYPIDRLAEAGATAAIEDQAYFETTRLAVMASRRELSEALGQLGFAVLPSSANFVFARHPSHHGAKLASLLRERHIVVRHFNQPRIDQYVRITVGTDEQCRILVQALSDIVSG